MIAFLILLAGYGAWRSLAALIASLRRLPRSNDDLVFW